MDITFKGKYKSITDFEWLNIPQFVVITGPNGSGKSQLLELIYKSIVQERSGSSFIRNDESKVIFTNNFEPDSVGYLKGEWELENTQDVDLSVLLNNKNNIFNQISNQGHFGEGQSLSDAHFKHELYLQNLRHFYQKYPDKKNFFENFSNFYEAEDKMAKRISELFFEYRLDEMELLAKKYSNAEIKSKIGEKPWLIVREIIKTSKLPFDINDPSEQGFRDSFKLKLTDIHSNEEINFSELSSGEKVLMSLVFYLYNSSERKVFPKILLLDEPDAHLHPAMAQQFIDVINKVLVETYGVQVIMTTHSPSTVILSPDESIYIMSREKPRINKAISKNHAVSLLTSGLVYVGEGTKYILVEDNDDKDFYTYIYDQLVLDNKIEPNIPLVFIPASNKETSGGKTVVSSWVNKLQNSGLTNIIHGLIDNDNGNPITEGIYKIDRYSIENYLSDPIVVYAALIEKERNPEIENLKFHIGEEYKLKSLCDSDMQKIADYIFKEVDSNLETVFPDFIRSEETIKVEVLFTTGNKLMYPKWLLHRKGKHILNNLYNRSFNSAVNYGTTYKALKKLNFFPIELIVKFEEIKSNPTPTSPPSPD
ncbi:AAA family ATPase [Flavobacterium sp. NRK1]|uniref:AAA family ATPase n=1 Tax=Flavobacterium sp. NRK1 TaxID=2954929 RepID=UPI0020925608|nr:AAA family ATPase [Flavobacterium sp. NRK1]MCO6147370.1 AAA family ATPase [Flavobacterium sp. NRK1]